MLIRSMLADDVRGALELWRTCEGVGLSEGDTQEQLEAFLVRNPLLSHVAFEEGRLVGAVLAGHDGRRGFLYHLAVRDEFRGRGLGRALAERATLAFRAVGITKCHVMVFRHNSAGEAFWIHLGWRRRDDINVHTLVAES
jgi:ribosomal protein S18 acetylase RimI-like enzyme